MHIHCPTLASITRLCVFKLYFFNILKLIVFKMYYHSTLKMTLFTGNFVQFNLHSFVYHSVCIFQYAVCMTYLYLPESIPSSSVSFRALSLPVSATGFISLCQQATLHPYLLVFFVAKFGSVFHVSMDTLVSKQPTSFFGCQVICMLSNTVC